MKVGFNSLFVSSRMVFISLQYQYNSQTIVNYGQFGNLGIDVI